MGLHGKEHTKSKVRLKNLWYYRNQKTKVELGTVRFIFLLSLLSPKMNQENFMSTVAAFFISSFTECIYRPLASAGILPISFIMMNLRKLSVDTTNK